MRYLDVLGGLQSRMRTTLLHALPVINYPQFEQACKRAEGAGPIPYSLLAATMAHAASYMPSLRLMHQPLWAHVLNALDAEFRQPRLQTLQLSMLLLSSRPGVNFAQSDITLSRVSLVHDHYLPIDNRRSPRSWPTSRSVAVVTTKLGAITADPSILDRDIPRQDAGFVARSAKSSARGQLLDQHANGRRCKMGRGRRANDALSRPPSKSRGFHRKLPSRPNC